MLNKLRDLEVCNEARKVLARMANVLLDEVCREQIHQTQQAFFSGRDIVVNNIRMHTCFREWVRNNPNDSTGALLLLLLDCSKGYNMLAWSLIQRCLEKAALPPTLVTLIMSLIKGEVRLMLHGHEFGGAVYQAGLPQGCPLSCFIFVICIDPLLAALRRTDGVNATSGFVDDWAAACQGTTWEQSLLVLEETLCAVEEFERASGSIINKDKSAIVPSRRLSPSEQDDCRRKWHDVRISYCERLLGLYIGVDATIDDQYRGPIEKFADALAGFSLQRHHMSLAVRIMVVNVFLWSLFSFQNRHLFMPRPLLQQLQAQALRFLTPVTWCSLGFFAHLRSVYGIRVQLTDLRLSNVAQLISSYCSHTEIIECTSNALQMTADRLQMGVALRPDLVRPADSFACAREFFCVTTGSLPEAFGACLQPAQAASTTPDLFRKLYRAMLAKDQTYWEGYLEVRLGARGWDPDLCVTGLRSLPRSVPQGHRWHLLRLHLNGHYSSSRVQAAGVTQNEGRCCFCHRGPDSVSHVLECPCVVTALEGLAAIVPVAGHITLSDLFFQHHADGAARAYMVAAFASIWAARFKHAASPEPVPPDVLASLIQKSLQCPWVENFLPTTTHKDRRAARVLPPPPVPGAYIFRSDGASRKSQHRAAGWGAAYWSPDGILLGTARGYLGTAVSNNVAEYCGLKEGMLRALDIASPRTTVCFEVDSSLVARQMQVFGIGKFACRSPDLRQWFLDCVRLGWRLEDNQVTWLIRHIYREFNQVADALANEAIDIGDSSWASP